VLDNVDNYALYLDDIWQFGALSLFHMAEVCSKHTRCEIIDPRTFPASFFHLAFVLFLFFATLEKNWHLSNHFFVFSSALIGVCFLFLFWTQQFTKWNYLSLLVQRYQLLPTIQFGFLHSSIITIWHTCRSPRNNLIIFLFSIRTNVLNENGGEKKVFQTFFVHLRFGVIIFLLLQYIHMVYVGTHKMSSSTTSMKQFYIVGT
jgi:hypothetical protein